MEAKVLSLWFVHNVFFLWWHPSEGVFRSLVLDCCVRARWQLWNYLCFVPLTVISSHRHSTHCTAVCLLPCWEILISSLNKLHFIKSNSRVSRVSIVSHSFTPISSGLWSPTKKYLEYSKCFLFKQALVLVCLTDRPHIKSKTIKGVFSNTGIALCVSNLRFLFILWSLQYKETIFGFRKKNLETIFFHLIPLSILGRKSTRGLLSLMERPINCPAQLAKSSHSTRHSPISRLVKARYLLSLISAHSDWS